MTGLDELDGLDCPDELDDLEELRTLLCRLIDRQNTILVELKRLDNLTIRALENSREAAEDAGEVRSELAQIKEDVDVVNAAIPDHQQEKLDRIRGILAYAVTEARGGPGGVKVDTGEAAAAAKTSRNTALRLMDEIGASFSWASTETPGGPNPKQLKLSIGNSGVNELMDDVRAKFGERGAT